MTIPNLYINKIIKKYYSMPANLSSFNSTSAYIDYSLLITI